MKKSLAALATASVLALGGIGFVGAPAQAACGYASCVGTKVSASPENGVRVGARATYKVKVRAQGNVRPDGRVKLVVTGTKGYRSVTSEDYSTANVTINSSKLPRRGTYFVKIVFVPAAGSIFDRSAITKVIRAR